VIDEEHEDVPQDQGNADICMWTRTAVHLLYMVVASLGILGGRMRTKMSLLGAFCRVVIAALLCLMVLFRLLLCLLLQFLRALGPNLNRSPPPHHDMARCLDRASPQGAGINGVCFRAQAEVWGVVDASLQVVYARDRG
jgi:hypothetical protein